MRIVSHETEMTLLTYTVLLVPSIAAAVVLRHIASLFR